jgi:hypothetical protein
MKRHLLHNIHINATKMKKKLKPKLKFILPPTEGVGGRGGEFWAWFIINVFYFGLWGVDFILNSLP